jgi:hypothetical protein
MRLPRIGLRVARAILSTTIARLARRCPLQSPADHPSTERIEHYGEECEFLPQPHIGDVSHPKLIETG